MKAGVFITGTDTDCGKTFVACEMLRAVRARGLSATGFKPVAAGAVESDGILRNDDALALIEASGPKKYPYELVNPYCLPAAVSPHLAADEVGASIDTAPILEAYEKLSFDSDMMVVEGAGGWRVPLAPGLDIEGLALRLRLPVVLVVGLRLGCLNHAQLGEEAILASGARLIGWVGTQVDPAMSCLAGNLQTLDERLATPCLGWFPHPAAVGVVPVPRPLAMAALLSSGQTI